MSHMPQSSQPSVPSWTLSDRLHKIRKDQGLTQEQIARALGIKPSTWAAWESGRNRPGDVLDLAVSLERRYGVSAAWTLGVLGSADRRQGPPSPDFPVQRDKRRRWTDVGTPMACTP